MIHYFAYGSNLHPIRLLHRVPSARLIGLANLDRHRLTFHKRSHDGSSKCNIFETGKASDTVHGAIYEIASEHRSDLDRFEGKGFGYTDSQIRLNYQEEEYLCFTYFAQQSHIEANLKPYHWYKEMVLLGARHLSFPDEYVSSINFIDSIEDPESNRRMVNEELLEKMRNYRS